jgi:CBS domain-containing protein
MQRNPITKTDELMTTSVITLRPTDTLADARHRMDQGLRYLPVVDDDLFVIGMVSDRDLARALAAGRDERTVVTTSMARAIRTVRPNTPAHEAVRLLRECRIGALPVIDAHDHLAGIVTRSDFLGVARHALGAPAAESTSAPVVDVW